MNIHILYVLCEVFIPGSKGAKLVKIDPEIPELQSKIK